MSVGAIGSPQQLGDAQRSVFWLSSSSMRYQPRFWPYRFAQHLQGFGIEDANEQLAPLHVHLSSDLARRQAVRRLRLRHNRPGAPPANHASSSETVPEAEQADRFFFGKHSRDLPLGGVVEAGVGATSFPTIRIGSGSAGLSKRFPWSARWAWPTPDSTFLLRSGALIRQGSATTP